WVFVTASNHWWGKSAALATEWRRFPRENRVASDSDPVFFFLRTTPISRTPQEKPKKYPKTHPNPQGRERVLFSGARGVEAVGTFPAWEG
uniref:hypothetical protein n=1 Tax=uncultured Acidovorax sp. TaxID=158751 RepID=UPI0030F6E9F4